jgi:hypothetical protein
MRIKSYPNGVCRTRIFNSSSGSVPTLLAVARGPSPLHAKCIAILKTLIQVDRNLLEKVLNASKHYEQLTALLGARFITNFLLHSAGSG